MKPGMIGYAGFGLACALAATIPLQQAAAYYHGGSWGGNRSGWSYQGTRGTASGGGGSWSASGYRGGSASGGGGSWSGTTYRGGTASGGEGSWHATGAYGGTASGSHYYGGSYYSGYHPPTVINHYGATCYNCGGWNAGAAWAAGITGAAVGATVGAAAASSANANASANAYTAGYAAGVTSSQPAYVMGSVYPALPSGCVYSARNGVAYYSCGATWFSPYYGANGTYYRVVQAP